MADPAYLRQILFQPDRMEAIDMSKSTIQDVDCDTLATWLKNDEAFLVDVREVEEHASAHIEGSVLNPLSVFDSSACNPRDGQKLVLYCGSGMRSVQAGRMLMAAEGRDVFNLVGGIQAWHNAGHPIVR